MPSPFQLNEFIDKYCRAFAEGTGAEIAAFYHAPCLTVRGDGTLHVFNDNSEIETFFQQVVTTYRDEGMAGFDCGESSTMQLGTACVAMSCEWIMLRNDSSVIRRWNQTYNFKETDDGWKVIVSIFHT